MVKRRTLAHKHHPESKSYGRSALLIAAAVMVASLGVYALTARDRAHGPEQHGDKQSYRAYQLKSEKGGFRPKAPAPYEFKIEDNTGATLKDFDTVHEKQMHVIVVRKDLVNFQHLHPEYNASEGTFKFSDLAFPTDGEYRIFADFTPTSSQMAEDGMKLPVTLHEDIKVGDMSRYQPQQLGDERLASSADGFATDIVQMPGDSASPRYYASTENRIPVSFRKDGQPYTELQDYLGALGHMIVLSEGELEFIHAHALSKSDSQQNGIIQFAVNFPKVGKYKLFLQTEAGGKVLTTDYVLTVSDPPSSGGNRQMNMDHGGGH